MTPRVHDQASRDGAAVGVKTAYIMPGTPGKSLLRELQLEGS